MVVVRQIDLKKIIAYSSIIHMNIATVALFVNNQNAIYGGLIAIINHSIVASLLFLLVGLLDDRYSTRSLKLIGGLQQYKSQFSIIFFVALLANFSFPLSNVFIGELLIILSLIHSNLYITLIIIGSILLNVVYLI
jgi:NADH-ubiquinone oxidoreductase chain 4